MFFEILLPKSKPITVGTTYRPRSQSKFLEVLSNNMNKIDSVNNKVFIHSDFDISWYLNDSYFLEKKEYLKERVNFKRC